jgi:(2R)-ethylmalonyl-CoA mutase
VPGDAGALEALRAKVTELERTLGRRPKLLVGKPGLDGHSNGAEQIAVAARDAGFEVIYQGIRLTPAEIAAAARDEDVDVVGLSILSGAHLTLARRVVDGLRAAGAADVEVVVGGIVPPRDVEALRAVGVSGVFPMGTPLPDIVAAFVERRRPPGEPQERIRR